MRPLAARALHGLFVLLGVSVLSFVMLELAPGDYFAEMRLDPRISEATVQALRGRYGLDRPLPERYLLWLASLASAQSAALPSPIDCSADRSLETSPVSADGDHLQFATDGDAATGEAATA